LSRYRLIRVWLGCRRRLAPDVLKPLCNEAAFDARVPVVSVRS
jgi:hypothetical protein